MADIVRKQRCIIRSENLDNSQYTRMKHEVVCPDVYYRIHPARVGWIPIYIRIGANYSFFCIQVVQNLQTENAMVRAFFVP